MIQARTVPSAFSLSALILFSVSSSRSRPVDSRNLVTRSLALLAITRRPDLTKRSTTDPNLPTKDWRTSAIGVTPPSGICSILCALCATLWLLGFVLPARKAARSGSGIGPNSPATLPVPAAAFCFDLPAICCAAVGLGFLAASWAASSFGPLIPSAFSSLFAAPE